MFHLYIYPILISLHFLFLSFFPHLLSNLLSIIILFAQLIMLFDAYIFYLYLIWSNSGSTSMPGSTFLNLSIPMCLFISWKKSNIHHTSCTNLEYFIRKRPYFTHQSWIFYKVINLLHVSINILQFVSILYTSKTK